MKKTKKLAALFLAMVMVFSLMAVTAAAYGAEEHKHDETCCEEVVMPRGPVCVCGEIAHVRNVGPTQILSKICPRLGSGLHVRVVVGSVYWCGACDMYVGANRAKSACMDACTGDPRSTECYNPNPKTLWGDPSQYASEAEVFEMLKNFRPIM